MMTVNGVSRSSGVSIRAPHYYPCTDQILGSLGQMYAGGGEMTAKIDQYAGEGTALFANAAIEAYLAAGR